MLQVSAKLICNPAMTWLHIMCIKYHAFPMSH